MRETQILEKMAFAKYFFVELGLKVNCWVNYKIVKGMNMKNDALC